MNYATIKYEDIANGSGIRTSLFVSGCTHYCKGCFNQEAWKFDFGKTFNREVEKEILESLNSPYISGLSLLGGEPMEVQNQRDLVAFLKEVKLKFPEKNIWCYTGYTYHVDLVPGGRIYTDVTPQILSCIDVLIDGKFIQELYDISLRFRGSSNQRLINLPETIEKNKIILWEEN